MKGNYKAARAFKTAVAKAKKLYKTGRYKTFADAVKAAYKTIGGVSKKNRQTGTSNRTADKKIKAKPPGKRVVKHPGGKSSVYYERRKNRSDVPGTVTGVGDAKALIRRSLKRKLSNQLLMWALATNKSNRRRIAKQVRETKAELKKYS